MAVARAVVESPLNQGEDEQIAYTLTTTPWGASPSSVAVTAEQKQGARNWTDVTSTVLSGSASVASDVITTPIVKSLTEGNTYRILIKFTSGGNIFSAYLELECGK